jgi:hypothetical protein
MKRIAEKFSILFGKRGWEENGSFDLFSAMEMEEREVF